MSTRDQFTEPTEEQQEAWQAFNDGLDALANAYGVEYDALFAALGYMAEDAISDAQTAQEVIK
jgi:hypothetical protein